MYINLLAIGHCLIPLDAINDISSKHKHIYVYGNLGCMVTEELQYLSCNNGYKIHVDILTGEFVAEIAC